MPRFASFLFLSLLAFAPPILAQQPASPSTSKTPSGPIQDNSFLVEEAYNQEDGVIQHINSFQKNMTSRDWVYTFTDEWPIRSYKHQLSLTLGATHAGDFKGSGGGWSDTAVNYRYQLVGNGEAKLAIAPRFSLLLPTGSSTQGRGNGGVGYQTDLPISIVHTSRWLTHWNAGATWVPHARNERGETAGITAVNLGQSVVWLTTQRMNLMLETVWTNTQNVASQGKTTWSQNLFISPGIRWSYNFANGLQIVPGVGIPIGIGPNAGEKGVLVYLSFEHPFAFAHSRPH